MIYKWQVQKSSTSHTFLYSYMKYVSIIWTFSPFPDVMGSRRINVFWNYFGCLGLRRNVRASWRPAIITKTNIRESKRCKFVGRVSVWDLTLYITFCHLNGRTDFSALSSVAYYKDYLPQASKLSHQRYYSDRSQPVAVLPFILNAKWGSYNFLFSIHRPDPCFVSRWSPANGRGFH